MTQEASDTSIRKVSWNLQESQDHPVHRMFLPGELSFIRQTHTFPVRAEQSYQRQSRLSAAKTSELPATNIDIAAGLTPTDHYTCNFSNIAIQIERSYLSVVAKQEEFCCGPRQGN
jgi:hypothetical protein